MAYGVEYSPMATGNDMIRCYHPHRAPLVCMLEELP